MELHLDIETRPDLDTKQSFIDESVDNFKAPSGLTKGKAAEDLGMTDEKEIKFTSKDAMIDLWVKEMAPKLAESVGVDNWKKTSFDGSKGRILSIAWAAGSDSAVSVCGEDELEVLRYFFKWLDVLPGKPFYVGHNVAAFDLKFIFHRAVILGLEPPHPLPFSGRHGQDYFDNMIAWAGYKDRISQDNLCKALGIEGKPDDIDGSKVCDYWLEGRLDEIRAYNEDDVEKSRKIFNRLNFR